MSIALIRQALETRLNTLSPAIATVFQNTSYTPTDGTPYQRVYLLPAPSRNPTFSSGSVHTLETGILQVSLYYPANVGSGAAEARAELIRGHFTRGLTLTSGSVSLRIEKTPTIHPAMNNEPGWYVQPISIRYFSNIFT